MPHDVPTTARSCDQVAYHLLVCGQILVEYLYVELMLSSNGSDREEAGIASEKGGRKASA